MQQPSALPPVLGDLRRMSARVGCNIHLVQGAGGNSSVKVDDVLWVKASGAWLSDAEAKDIFVPVQLSGARAALAAREERMPVATGFADTGLRASIETSLHALMPHRVVLHVHAVNTIAWGAREDAQDELARRLDGLAWRQLPYRRPGLPLSQAVAESAAKGRADVLILGNHGLLVGAETCDGAEALIGEVERRLELAPRAAPAGDRAALQRLCAGTGYRPAKEGICHELATEPHNLSVATAGSLYPDHVVFLGPALPTIRAGETVAAATARVVAAGAPPPVALLAPGTGAVVRNDIGPGAEAMLICLGLVVARLPEAATVKYLPAAEEHALLNWDAERYRQQMMAART
jgi:rhamnose utilization protein RhaD (predicted bifunctional aldolase and dehydrogenase)